MRAAAVAVLVLMVASSASASVTGTRVSLSAPAWVEPGELFRVEGSVSSFGWVPSSATVDFLVDGVVVRSVVVVWPWFSTEIRMPDVRGQHTVQAVAWSQAGALRGESAVVVVNAADRPSSPVEVVAAPEPETHAVRVSWSPPLDDGGAEVSAYHVYRAPGGTDSWSLRGSVEGTSLVDATRPSTAYRYRVAAANVMGEGASSPVVEVTSGPEVEADAVSVSGLRFKVCWNTAAYSHTCKTVGEGASVSTSSPYYEATVIPFVDGVASRGGSALPFAEASGSYDWTWTSCPPGHVCIPGSSASGYGGFEKTVAREDGSFTAGEDPWGRSFTFSGCWYFVADGYAYAGTASASRTAHVKVCR